MKKLLRLIFSIAIIFIGSITFAGCNQSDKILKNSRKYTEIVIIDSRTGRGGKAGQPYVVVRDNSGSSEDKIWARPEYYKDAIGKTADQLYLAIQTIMNETHTTKLSYGDIRYLYGQTDYDPNNTSKMLGFYTANSLSPVWDSAATWNREHVWPKSVSYSIDGTLLYKSTNNSYKGPGSDMHHIRPESTKDNGSRGNTPFGESTGYWSPPDNRKGDVARIMFYMCVHYNMDLWRTDVCESIDILLKWNDEDPVDQLEINRNNAVYKLQGNYNPFIDNPWIAREIFE